MSGTTYALIGICVLLFVGYINLHFGKSAAVREVERHRRDIASHTAKVQHLQAQHTLKDRSREEMQASIDSLNKRLETAEAALQREAVKAKEFEEKVARRAPSSCTSRRWRSAARRRKPLKTNPGTPRSRPSTRTTR